MHSTVLLIIVILIVAALFGYAPAGRAFYPAYASPSIGAVVCVLLILWLLGII